MLSPNAWVGGKSFREAGAGDWHVRPGDDPVAAAQAWYQFRLARQVWAQVDSRRVLRVKDLADLLGQHYETQRRKLVGDEPADGRDLALWVLLGDPEADPTGDLGGVFAPGVGELVGGWRLGSGRLPEFSESYSDIASIDWHLVADGLHNELHDADERGLLDLLTRPTLSFLLARVLQGRHLPSEKLDYESGMLSVGVPSEALLDVLTILGPKLRSGAVARQNRIQAMTVVARLAESDAPINILIVVADARGRQVMSAAVPLGLNGHTNSQGFSIGPFDPSLGFAPVWAKATAQMRQLASSEGDLLSIAILEVGKFRARL